MSEQNQAKRGKKLPKRTGQRGKKAAHGRKATREKKRRKFNAPVWDVRSGQLGHRGGPAL